MERSDLLKVLVVFIAIIFVLSMFSQFGKDQQDTTQGGIASEAGNAIGTGIATCRITAYAPELSMDSWNADLSAVTNMLKSEKRIEYVNTFGKRSVLLLPTTGNATAVRSEFANYSVNIEATAGCNVNAVINFTLQNKTVKPLAVSTIKLSIDPYTQIDDELDLDLTADIGEAGIVSLKAVPRARVAEAAVNTSAVCSDNYRIEAMVPWENRAINTTVLAAEIGIPVASIRYQKNDIVTFSRQLNATEVAAIRAENLSFVTDLGIGGLAADTNERAAITSLTERYSTTPTFQPSPILIETKGRDALTNATKAADAYNMSVARTQRGCSLALGRMMNVNDIAMLITPAKRQIDYYLNDNEVSDTVGGLGVFGTASYIGRTVTDFKVIGTK